MDPQTEVSIRDFAIFQLKLLIGGLKDGAVFAMSFVAFGIDLLFRRHRRRRFFYEMMTVRARSSRSFEAAMSGLPRKAKRPRVPTVDRRRPVATLQRGGETPDQPHNRPVPTTLCGISLHVDGLRWHDPDHASRGAPVVGAPSHSYGYGVVALTHAIVRVPRIWGRGIPGTRALARVAAHCTPSTAF